MCELLESDGTGKVLEIGTGSGYHAAVLSRLFERVYTAFLETMKSAGFNPYLGVDLANMLRGVELEDVLLRGWTGEWTAAEGNPTGAVYRLTFEKMRDRMTTAGVITNEEADQFLADMQSPDFHAITGIHFAAWGRKPS